MRQGAYFSLFSSHHRALRALACGALLGLLGSGLAACADEEAGLFFGNTGGGGDAGQGGMGGEGGAAGTYCVIADDCPEASFCNVPTCINNACRYEPLAEGTLTSPQVPGDCRESQCDGAGNIVVVKVSNDAPSDGLECTADYCEGGLAKHDPVAQGTPCSTGSCNADGICSECSDDADCELDPCGGVHCVAGRCRGHMVDRGDYCIGLYEVTNAEYAVFLQGTDPGQDALCAWNTSYQPLSGAPPLDDHPVTGVDWCDAAAYCKSVGKNLCGARADGPVAPALFSDASQDAWFDACSNGGTSLFPYGDGFIDGACNGVDAGVGAPADVGSFPACQAPEGAPVAPFDLSGNVWEWEDACAASTGTTDFCRVRGGSFNNVSASLRCDTDYSIKRGAAYDSVGIRCCSN